MTRKRFTWITAMVVCVVLGLAGVSSAANLRYDVNSQKWRDLEVQRVPWRNGSDVDNDYYGTNCYCFVDWVLKDEGRGELSGFCYEAYLNGLDGIMLAQYLNAHHNSSGPSEAQVREAFQKASAGDVVQMRWSYSAGGSNVHTALINGFESNGVYFFQSHVSGYGVKKISNSFYSYSDLARRYANPGYRGGFSIYRFGTIPYPPIPPISEDTRISQGLRNLTSSRYAKIFTLTSSRYTNLYSNKELTNRLSSSSWTGESDEDYITEVGVNSSNVVYAKISYPISSGRRDAYVRLRELFVKGTETESFTAAKSAYGLYKRQNSGQTYSYGIDAGDQCYLLTKENGWCQVMYPIPKNLWRVAWMSEATYNGIKPQPTPVPVITSIGDLPKIVVAGTRYSNAITATGATPITWSTSAGTLPEYRSYFRTNLPPGLSISGSGTTGTISGYPSHTSDGQSSFMPLTYIFNITATNSAGPSAPKSSNIAVYEPPVFETSSILPTASYPNARYNQTIRAKGTEFSMHWKIIEGKLPPGLTFTGKDSKREATITGVPTQTGVFKFKVRLYNLVGNADTTTEQWFTISVGNPATEYSDSRIKFSYNFLNGRAGNSFYDWTGITDSSSSGTKNLDNYIFSVSEGSLPAGLSLEERAASGYNVGKLYLSGIPTTSGVYTFTLKAKRISDGGYSTRKYAMTIMSATTTTWRDSSMTLRYSFLPGKMRVNYRDYVYVRGGSAPYTPSVVAGELPPGTRLEASGNYIYLTGVPKRAGSSFTFTMRVTGRNGGYVQQDYTVNIATNPYYKSGSSSSASKPKYISKELPNADAGSQWEATLECSGTEPIAWYAVGELPDWMTLDEETGRISGIPMEVGKYKFKIKAENEIGSVTKTFKVKVVKAAPTIVTSSLPDGYTGVDYEARLEAFGTEPIKWSKIGKLPSGLKLDKKEGIIYGTPKKSYDSFDITVKAKNKAGTETATLKIRILKTDDFIEDGKDNEEIGDDDESDNNTETESEDVPATVSDAPEVPIAGHASGAVFTKLYLLSGDERLEGSVSVEAGTPLTFEIGQWQDESGRNIDVSDMTVYVNDEAVSADVSEEGVFTLPSETVNGEIIVYASARSGGREFRTLEIDAIAGTQDGVISASEAGSSGNSDSSSTSGCNAGILGVAGLIFAGILASGKGKKSK